jgi:hypothetical protein
LHGNQHIGLLIPSSHAYSKCLARAAFPGPPWWVTLGGAAREPQERRQTAALVHVSLGEPSRRIPSLHPNADNEPNTVADSGGGAIAGQSRMGHAVKMF